VDVVPPARVVFADEDRAEVARRVDDALRTGALTLGANTREFEEAFAAEHQVPYAVAVTSGTAAIEIVLRALDVAGRDVIVPANTFAATAFATIAAGARPIFADVDRSTMALSVETVTAAMTPSTAAVVIVHIGGLVSPETPALRALCDEHGIVLVEDAAHAHGSTLTSAPAGSIGTAGTFSFYPTKVITSGEGGMIVTADEGLRDEALAYRDQGKAGFGANLHTHLGYAWRMSELHAAVGVVHLRRLPEFLAVRKGVAARYDEAFREHPLVTPLVIPPASSSNYYKYVAMLSDDVDRAALKNELADRFGVQLSGEVYETPLHHQPVFAKWADGPLPVAERVCARHVCLPIHSDMTEAEVAHVVDALTEIGERR
jgi:dTDP-4-amino-4,6-dideoxygalactose transaminase